MEHVYDLRHNMDQDDWELGLRVACRLYLENVNQNHFVNILALQYGWAIQAKTKS